MKLSILHCLTLVPLVVAGILSTYLHHDRVSFPDSTQYLQVDSPTPGTLLKKVDSVQLSEEVLIGRIGDMDVAPNGDFLIVDSRNPQTIVFDRNGDVKKTLQPSDCNPGFSGGASGGYFVHNGIVLDTSLRGGAYGYRFTRDGDCVEGLHEDFFQPQEVVSDQEGHLYGFYEPRGLEEPGRIAKMDSMGKNVQTFPLPKTEFPVMALTMRSEGLVYSDGHIYYAAATIGPDVYRLSAEDGALQVLKVQPPTFYRPITEDRSKASLKGAPASFQSLKKLTSSSSITDDFFLLDENRLMVQWLDIREKEREGWLSMQIITTDGKVIGEDVGYRRRFQTARNGYAYAWRQPDATESGEVPNPYILIYEYTGG